MKPNMLHASGAPQKEKREMNRKLCDTLRSISDPLYALHREMLDRCYDPASPLYPYYGGAGIAVCSRWHTYDLFQLDMGEPKPPATTLTRINTAKDYARANCKWKHNLDSSYAPELEKPAELRYKATIKYPDRLF